VRQKKLRRVMTVHDRYSATGRPRPDPRTVCKGRCEGMGFYPDMVKARAEGLAVRDVPFVKCERCGGTGREP
jgi:hypothetical protein